MSSHLHIVMFLFVICSVSDLEAQIVGNCEPGTAEAVLTTSVISAPISNRGKIFTIPNDFFAPDSNYVMPSGHNFWFGARADGEELVFAGSIYSGWDEEYWPGPLDNNANPPEDCSLFDRIYEVSTADLEAFRNGHEPTQDMLDWPVELGAPVADGDGISGNYDLFGGDLPQIHGDHMAWWLTNDVGNAKPESKSPPAGIEVRTTAYAFDEEYGILARTLFFSYEVTNRSQRVLADAYFGFWTRTSETSFLASVPESGLGLAYTDDLRVNTESSNVGGAAFGYDILNGPIPSGATNEFRVSESGRLQATAFIETSRYLQPWLYYDEGGPYETMKGKWVNGVPVAHGAYQPIVRASQDTTTFMYPANPAKREYWTSEYPNLDGSRAYWRSGRNIFVISSGPFTLLPGESSDVELAIILSSGQTGHHAYTNLIKDDIYIQGHFDNNFVEQETIDAPVVDAAFRGDSLIISWDNPPSSNNANESFDVRSGFVYNKLGHNPDLTYTFEGYDVIQYVGDYDSVGTVIATYDAENNIHAVGEERYDPDVGLYVAEVVATGDDTGVRHQHVITDIVNYQEYHFGVQAYAYNENSQPQIHRSNISRVSVIPGEQTNALTALEQLTRIGIVPNPYRASSAYEASLLDSKVRFTAMPDQASVKIFTLAGTLIRELEKNDTLPFLEWDLTTEEGFQLGSGLYLVHITVPGAGERVIKFGHIGRK